MSFSKLNISRYKKAFLKIPNVLIQISSVLYRSQIKWKPDGMNGIRDLPRCHVTTVIDHRKKSREQSFTFSKIQRKRKSELQLF